ncbi:flagellar protein FlaG [Clostridium oceanicum]|uniref:Flagellar protein FlaG n=1 Tax=Clostridium oceanicum TaxID=1543 RepID=A0ABN1JTR9_9CLOT
MEVNNLCQGRQLNLDISLKDGQNDSLDTNNSYLKGTTKKPVDKKDLKYALDKLDGFLKNESVHVEYEIHDKLKDIMIKIVDDDTQEVIKEIPPRKILDMVAKMCEMVGIIVDKKA